MNFQQDFEQRVDASLDRYTIFLERLLRIPTPRMQEHECVRFLGAALEGAGLSTVYFDGLGLGEPTPAGPPLNLHTCRRGAGKGRSLLLEAHMDTVPAGDAAKWRDDPWSGAIRDGRIYARGSHDDRTGAAMLWMLADVLHQMRAVTEGDLWFLVTTEEEYSCGGMQAYIARPDAAHPDAHLALDGNRTHFCILGHAGVASFKIRMQGPWGSIFQRDMEHDANPIEHSAAMIQGLREFELKLREHVRALNPDSRWPEPKVVVTQIDSCNWFSNIPEDCTIGGMGNVIPPMTIVDFKAMLEEFVANTGRMIPWMKEHPPEVIWGPLEMPGYAIEESADFYRSLNASHQRYFNLPLQPRYIGGWGDMRLLNSPNLIFYGPGGGGGDHNYDEYFELSDLAPTLKTLGTLIADWCGIRS